LVYFNKLVRIFFTPPNHFLLLLFSSKGGKQNTLLPLQQGQYLSHEEVQISGSTGHFVGKFSESAVKKHG
jgi:hypothetical protein